MSRSRFVGVAGVHYVASYLAYRELHAVPTTRNIGGPDVLVSNPEGSKSVTLQVKTARCATRTRGRGDDKRLDHYEWDIGWGSARLNHRDPFFALVDLKNFDKLPDVFFVPSREIYDQFKDHGPEEWPRARVHPPIAWGEPYKNNWEIIKKALT